MALRRRTTQVDSYEFERGLFKLNTYLPRGNMTLSRVQGGLMHDSSVSVESKDIVIEGSSDQRSLCWPSLNYEALQKRESSWPLLNYAEMGKSIDQIKSRC